MRSTTKTFVASVGIGICAISYAVGANASQSSGFSANGLPSNTASPSDTASASSSSSASASNSTSASASASASSSNSASSTKTASSGGKKTKTTKPSGKTSGSSSSGSSSSTSASPSSSSSSGSGSSGSSNTTVTKQGDLIHGNDPYGDYIQLSVTKTNGKVTAVNIVQQYATPRWQSAYSQYLVPMAINSNGAQVSNLSGATYCTRVFNAALASAMSKF